MPREAIPGALEGERLDRAVALICDCSRSMATTLIENGDVTVDGRVITSRSVRLSEGEVVDVTIDESVFDPTPIADDAVPFTVLYSDDDVIVIDKPAGVVVHPGAGNTSGTLVNGLVSRYPELVSVGQPERPGIVHRLDKGTSGVMMVARTSDAYDALVADLSNHDVEREYVALCWGDFENDRGTIDAPIGRSARQRAKMTVSESGRDAVTHYEVLGRYVDDPALSAVRCQLETGRTHQIRVHLNAIGHPVVADDVYGARHRSIAGFAADRGRVALHAQRLRFRHPSTGEFVEAWAPLPDDLNAAFRIYFPELALSET